MSVIRIKHSDFETKYTVPEGADTTYTDEWGNGDNRVNEAGWQERYQYETDLICSVMEESNPKTILELGPGPGVLSEMIQKKVSYPIDYTLIDKPFAKEAFDLALRNGNFLVQDVSGGLDISDLKPHYDMVICNDTLEHLFNPSDIIQKIHNLLTPTGIFFISVPNWRMGHQFVYRGLFDYDNFLYFMLVHKFTAIGVYPSPLQTPDYPRLNSEEEMEEELRRSWNWYFTFQPTG